MGTAATCSAGTDVSEGALDACLLLPGGRAKEHTFADDARGRAAPLTWAERHARGAAVHYRMEATGPYSEAPAAHPADAGRLAGVVNPTRVEYAGLARGRGNETDRADARLIAGSAARERPGAWQPPPPEVRELRGLVRRIDDLTEAAAREKGRRASPALTAAVCRSVERTVRLLEKEAAKPGPRPTSWSPPPRRCGRTGTCWRVSPASGGGRRPPSWPSCRRSSGCRAPSRPPPTAGCRRASTRAAPA